jgi:hypothetical protein
VEHDQVAQRCHVKRVDERTASMHGGQRGRSASLHGAPQFFSGRGSGPFRVVV